MCPTLNDDDEVYRALARLKDSLQINLELASPPDFIPEPAARRRVLTFALERLMAD